MRLAVIAVFFAVLGVAAGVGATVVELGLSPAGTPVWSDESSGQALSLPRVVVEDPEFDFGSMERDATRSHIFVIHNLGDAPLRLSKLETTCKCTLGQFGDSEIPPGGSTDVTLEWTAITREGEFRQTATIATNDPRRSQLRLTVHGRVVYSHLVVPERLVFDSLSTSAGGTNEVRVYASRIGDLQVTDYSFENADGAKLFDVAVSQIPKDQIKEKDAKSGVLVRVTARPGLPLEPIRQTLRLKTNLPDRPEIEIPIEGTVRGDVSIAGLGWNQDFNVLTLGRNGTIKSADGFTVELKLLVRGPFRKEVQLQVAEVDPDLLQVEVGEPEHRRAITVAPLTVRVPPGASAVDHTNSQQGKLGEVRLETGLPQSPELRFKVRFVVEE